MPGGCAWTWPRSWLSSGSRCSTPTAAQLRHWRRMKLTSPSWRRWRRPPRSGGRGARMRELEFQAADWEETSLGDLCTFRGGNGFKEEHQGQSVGEFPFIKVSDLTLPGNEKHITNA